MLLTILFHNTHTNKIYDISNLVSTINYKTLSEEQPSSVTLEVINRDNMDFPSGSILSVKAGDKPVFLGYLFKQSGGDEESTTLTFYDQLKYLQYKDTLVLGGKTLGELFQQVCYYKALNHRVVDNVNFKLPITVYEDKTLYDMLASMIRDVYIATGKKFIIWDNFGVLELRDVEKLKLNLYFGDGSLMTAYSYNQSIDDEVFNIVKLIREDTETKKLETALELDRNTIKYWGQLQYFAKVDENVGDLKTYAKNLLQIHNRESKTLTIECLGDLRIRAGNGIIVEIDKIKKNFNSPRYYLVEECTHEISDTHTMSLKLRVI